MGRYHLFLLLVFVGVAASLPQKVETYLKTFYVAVTEVAFDSQPSVCISLINATRPCIGSGRSARMNPAPPPMVQRLFSNLHLLISGLRKTFFTPCFFPIRVEHTIDPKAFLSIDEETNNQDSIVMSSINDRSNRAEQPHQTGFFRLFTRGFSNALGLVRAFSFLSPF